MKRILSIFSFCLGAMPLLWAQADSALVAIQMRPYSAQVVIDDTLQITRQAQLLTLAKGSQHKISATEPHSSNYESWFTVDTASFSRITITMQPAQTRVTMGGLEGMHYTLSRNDSRAFRRYQQKMKKTGYECVNSATLSGVTPTAEFAAQSGPVKIRLTKRHHVSQTLKTNLIPDGSFHCDANLRYLPLRYFGSVVVGKPSAESKMAYGAEVGAVRRWGAYARFLTTIGQNATGDDVDLNLYKTELENPYLTSACSYQEYVVGCAYRPFRHVTFKAGMGIGNRNSVWEGLDGETHNYAPDQQKGLLYDAGIMFDYGHVALSCGASLLEGNATGMVGLGLFW